MEDFIRRFVGAAGSWNDEAGTKAYALEFVLATIQFAGKAALADTGRFKAVIPHFSIDNPLAKGRSLLAYYGAKDFRQKRQIGIPLRRQHDPPGRAANPVCPEPGGDTDLAPRDFAKLVATEKVGDAAVLKILKILQKQGF